MCMSTSPPRPEAEHPPYPLFALAPSYTPTPTTGPAQERALLSLSAHQRTSYDAIPIDHTAPLNASSLFRASLAPDAPPRFLPPSLDPSQSVVDTQPEAATNGDSKQHVNDRFEPIPDADSSIVTSALAALDASRSAEPSPNSEPCRGSEDFTEPKSE